MACTNHHHSNIRTRHPRRPLPSHHLLWLDRQWLRTHPRLPPRIQPHLARPGSTLCMGNGAASKRVPNHILPGGLPIHEATLSSIILQRIQNRIRQLITQQLSNQPQHALYAKTQLRHNCQVEPPSDIPHQNKQIQAIENLSHNIRYLPLIRHPYPIQHSPA